MVTENKTFNNVLSEQHAEQLVVDKAAADLGNGQTEVWVNGSRYTFDSGYRIASLSDINFGPEEAFTYGKGLIERTYVKIISQSVESETGCLLAFGSTMNAFVGSIELPEGSKVKQDSPIMHLLTTLAVDKVQQEFNKTQKASNLINASYKINIDLLTALPAKEATAENREYFKERLVGKRHQVIVYLSQTDTVMVEINFTKATIKAEGSFAYQALVFFQGGFNGNPEIFEEAREMYQLPNYGGQDITTAPGYRLIIDIGEITTEFQLFDMLGTIDSGKSEGIQAGTRDIYEASAKEIELNRDKYKVISKKEVSPRHITAALKDENHPGRTALISLLVSKSDGTAREIVKGFRAMQQKVDGNIQVVMVIGGGSIILKEKLLPMLKNNIEKWQPDGKVVYVPKEYAQEIFYQGMVEYREGI